MYLACDYLERNKSMNFVQQKIKNILLWLVFSVVIAFSINNASAMQSINYPKPTGEFAVGTKVCNRQSVWYPAQIGDEAKKNRMGEEFIAVLEQDIPDKFKVEIRKSLNNVHSHAYCDAPLLDSFEAFPVISIDFLR